MTKNERKRDRRVSEAEEQRLLDACKLLNEPPRTTARLNWEVVREIRSRAQDGVPQHELAKTFNVSRPLCNEIVRGHIWDPDAKLTVGDEMRDRIIGALDTGCRRGESKTEVERVIPFEPGGRLEKLLRRRAFLGPDAYVFGNATTGEYVGSFRSAWETLLLLANDIAPTRHARGRRVANRDVLERIDRRWHDLRHEALSRLADDGVPFTNWRCSLVTRASRRRSAT